MNIRSRAANIQKMFSKLNLWRRKHPRAKPAKAKQKKIGKSSNERSQSHDGKWSVDWENFDWETVSRKLDIAEKELAQNGDKKTCDVGISQAQLEEYFLWLHENRPDMYEIVVLYMLLREKRKGRPKMLPAPAGKIKTGVNFFRSFIK